MASRASRSIAIATATAILALPQIAATAAAQEHEVGHWMPLGSYSTTNPQVTPKRGYHGVRLQQGRIEPSALDDLPRISAAIRPPVLDDRKYTNLVDAPNRPASSPKNLGSKPPVNLSSLGIPFSGTYRADKTTHKLGGR
jgi:hypothetical protein